MPVCDAAPEPTFNAKSFHGAFVANVLSAPPAGTIIDRDELPLDRPQKKNGRGQLQGHLALRLLARMLGFCKYFVFL